MDPERLTSHLLAPTVDYLASVKVFPLIPALRRDITNTIDSALSWDQLTAADINFSIVRPIVNKYARLKNMAVVYACLVVRSYFLTEAETDLAFAGVMISRSNLCEILAIKLLSRFATDYIQLVAVLTTNWNPLAGASSQVLDEVKHILNAHDDDIDSKQSAIEMAIATRAKTFLASTVAQKVVNDIYSGRVVYSVAANRSILADNYKPRAIEIYNPDSSPFIDHYRLRVPKYGAYLEFVNFAILLLTFVLCLSNHDNARITIWEAVFIIMGSAFALAEYTASTEHGWIIYIANMWNGFDFAFIVIFFIYLGIRIKGIHQDDLYVSGMAFQVLSCGACILFPRLAFFAVSNNVIVLSLRAMISQFVFFIGMAAICFSGLLFTLWTLVRDDPAGQGWTLKSIAWLMVQIWFGNTYLSFAQAASFHPIFGPILMTIFAALANTLLLTILISILSNTVARIDANATNEYLFQFTITTIEGVKSDALFSYQPPFNILAFIILKPSSWMLTPRALHSLNVFLIKLTSFPLLLLIGLYERHISTLGKQRLRQNTKDARHAFFHSLPWHIKNMPLLEAIVGSASNDILDAIFDVAGGEVCEGSVNNIFGDENEEEVDASALMSMHSKENLKASNSSGVRRNTSKSKSRSPVPRIRARRATNTSSQNDSTPGSPTGKMRSIAIPGGADVFAFPDNLISSPSRETISSAINNRSPLARLFTSRLPSSTSSESTAALAAQAVQAATSTEASIRHIEALLEAVGQLPVHKLKEEMKELQERQARIENLLLMLTRGMRNETPRQSKLS